MNVFLNVNSCDCQQLLVDVQVDCYDGVLHAGFPCMMDGMCVPAVFLVVMWPFCLGA